MQFDENSTIVQSWVRSIQNGRKTRAQVPNLHNLREVVFAILDANGVA